MGSCAFLVGSNSFSGPITSTSTALLRERFSKISKKIEGRAVKYRTARENRKLSQAARGLELCDFCETVEYGAQKPTQSVHRTTFYDKTRSSQHNLVNGVGWNGAMSRSCSKEEGDFRTPTTKRGKDPWALVQLHREI